MNCLFLRRRGGNALSVKGLFSKMVVLYKSGNNSTSSARSYIPAASLQAVSGTAYIISISNATITGCAWGIWRVTNGTISSTPVYHPNSGTGGVAYNTSTGNAYYYQGGWVSSSSTTGSSGYYSIALVQFTGVSAAAAERVMLNAVWAYNTRIYNTSGTSSTSISDSDAILHDAVLVSKGNYFDCWVPDNGTMTRLSGTSTAAASHSANKITISGNIGTIYTLN